MESFSLALSMRQQIDHIFEQTLFRLKFKIYCIISMHNKINKYAEFLCHRRLECA